MEVQVDTDRPDGYAVVRLNGEIDHETAGTVRTSVFQVIDAGHPHVVIDLSGVGFLDSSGLGTLVGARRHAEQARGSVTLCGLSHHVRRLFEITRMVDTFTILDSTDDLTHRTP
jgi:anti-sigma B factor antagonist